MKIKNASNVSNVFKVAAVIMSIATSSAVHANPTGAPLVYFPVEPCRFMDTRVSQALPNQTALDGFVRGASLQSSTGASTSSCGVPPTAEAVKSNITILNPLGSGYIKINGTGFVTNPNSSYARMVYGTGQNYSNEMTISLCNLHPYPITHEPCLYDDQGRYSDFQIINFGFPIHIVGDVVGYFEAMP